MALIQKNSKTVNAVLSTTLTFTSNVTNGNLLIAVVGGGSGVAPGTPSVSDNLNGSYTGGPGGISLDDSTQAKLFWIKSTASGSCTVTVNTSGSITGILDVIILEYSGIPTSPFDVQNGMGESSSTGNITTANANDLLIAFSVGTEIGINVNGWSASNSFVVEQAVVESNGNSSLVVADRTVTATGTYNSTFTNSAGPLSPSAASGIIAFKFSPTPTVGTNRYGVKTFLQPVPANQIPYKLCVNNNRLYCILPDNTGIFSCFVYYLGP